MHDAQQRRGHNQHCNNQTQQEGQPARLRGENFLFTQLPVEQRGVQAGRQADGQRQTRMLQRADKRQVHYLGHNQGDNSNLDRGLDVLTGIEARRQHFHHDKAHQPYGISHQRALGHRRVKGAEFAVLEQSHGQRFGEDPQRHRARQRQQKTETQSPVHQPAILVMVTAGEAF